jgi:serine/threonine protein kinase/tetratricopeptide (TPR) repeat protein
VSTPNAHDLIGQTIGSYVIVARVGGGGMGVVYRARDTKLGRTVALKFLPPQWSHDEDARQRFIREAQAASATNHPNICTIHDIATAPDGQLFIVMAYYEGKTLKQRLASGPLSVDESLDIATQIADGLAKAHAQGVVHRDVKPGNVILTEDGARIVDFGLATFADALKLTVEHSTLGTAAYMSPEQVRGQGADARSDVWAVGIILYEMLTGHVPFQGSHAEAIAYAVRHETPASIRASRPEVGEDLEQLVFRAIHKEASVRFKDGREMARSLRQVRGLSLPLDLRTQPVAVPRAPAHEEKRSTWKKRATATGLALALVASLTSWALWPAERIPIAVVPVVNLTGYSELDAFLPGLTHLIAVALMDSPTVRAIGHEHLSSILKGVQRRGHGLSSGEALQAIKANTAAQVFIVVSIRNRSNGSGFSATVEFRDRDTLTVAEEPYETAPVTSAIINDTAYRLIAPVVDGIEAHFRAQSGRARFKSVLRGAFSGRATSRLPVRTLDAAAALEGGIAAYEALEYPTAFDRFGRAAQDEPLNPLPLAWQSRAARAMRRDIEAEKLARLASTLLSEDTPERDRLFAEGVVAETRQDAAKATELYSALKDRYKDDPMVLQEFAALLERQGKTTDAIAGYHAALARAPYLLRPRLDLCRLYNRLNQPVEARDYGRRAAEGYRTVGDEGGQMQALFCLTDSLRVGEAKEREAAVAYATEAVQLGERSQYPYNLPRAYNYQALAFESQGRLHEAAQLWERALPVARAAGNTVLEPLLLMNLGATYEKLGKRVEAVDYLRRSSRLFGSLGDQSRAAENLFNLGGLLLAYGGDPAEGLRSVGDALEVFRSLSNRAFEVRGAHLMSTHYRYLGRYADAIKELNKAVALASERDQDFRSAITSIRFAQTYLETGRYEEARKVLTDALPKATARSRLEAQIYLARAHIRLGDYATAVSVLESVQPELTGAGDTALLPLFYATLGDLAAEQKRVQDARSSFSKGAALLTQELPDMDALEATASLALQEAAHGADDRARATLNEILRVARSIGHVSLQARCHIFLAQLDVMDGHSDRALREIADVPVDDGSRAIERELRIQAYFWSSRAHTALGDPNKAAADLAAARGLVQELSRDLEEEHRATFLKRPPIQDVLQ